MRERVIVIGQGAREHALAYKLSVNAGQAKIRDVLVLGGNAGIATEFECITPRDNSINGLRDACLTMKPDLVVIGPESYLAEGLADVLRAGGLAVFGPSKKASLIEASKAFSKIICQKAKIATAGFEKFSTLRDADRYVDHYPHEEMVIKIDGLCAGKGVTVCFSKNEAHHVLRDMFLNGGFLRLGIHNTDVIIEDYLVGSEVSVFGAAHNNEVVLFSPMQDYKRLRDRDLGPNTGGMGAVGPLGKTREERRQFLQRIKEEIFLPALSAMHQEQRPFSGLLYAGLMLLKSGPHLLEFNARFGDPETQALLFGTKADIYPLLKSIADGDEVDADFFEGQLLEMDPTIAIVLASKGYPTETHDKVPLALPATLSLSAKLFFAAVHNVDGQLMAGAGRVLNVVASKPVLDVARSLGYEMTRQIDFLGMHYRHDIGTNVTALS